MKKPIKAYNANLTDLKFDQRNANSGTAEGDAMLGTSIEELGLGRGIIVDANLNVIGGNKTLEKAGQVMDDLEIIVVDTLPNQLVATRRVDLDLYSENDQTARRLAHADNRVGLTNYSPAVETILEDIKNLDLGAFYNETAIKKLVASVTPQKQTKKPKAKGEKTAKREIKAGDIWVIGGHKVFCVEEGDEITGALWDSSNTTVDTVFIWDSTGSLRNAHRLMSGGLNKLVSPGGNVFAGQKNTRKEGQRNIDAYAQIQSLMTNGWYFVEEIIWANKGIDHDITRLRDDYQKIFHFGTSHIQRFDSSKRGGSNVMTTYLDPGSIFDFSSEILGSLIECSTDGGDQVLILGIKDELLALDVVTRGRTGVFVTDEPKVAEKVVGVIEGELEEEATLESI